jgi:hypothetical protein
MREFNVIDSAVSVEKLRLRLKDNELEQYGQAFTPDFVYEVINRLPRFSSMRVCTLNPFFKQIANLLSAAINKMRKNFSASSLKVSTMNVYG